MITREVLATRLRDYLQHRITRAALVDCSEHAIVDEELDGRGLDTIRDIASRLGLADVREFGLTSSLVNRPVAKLLEGALNQPRARP